MANASPVRLRERERMRQVKERMCVMDADREGPKARPARVELVDNWSDRWKDAAALLAEEPTVFATNQLQIAVHPGNPAVVTGLDDLAGVDIVVCAPAVPCGAAAVAVAEAAGVRLDPVGAQRKST